MSTRDRYPGGARVTGPRSIVDRYRRMFNAHPQAVGVPSGADAGRIAQEQAALRRLATLVAEGLPPARLFAAVTKEVGSLLDADLAGLIRFEPDDMVIAVATWAASGDHADVSGRWPLEGDRIATKIVTSGLPTREDAWAEVDGPIAAFVRGELGVHSSVGSPVVVDGRVWGALFVHSTQPEQLPGDTEVRLGQFTQLVATAVANAQAHEDLQRLAEEQAALRRVAELVARGAPANEVFATVAEELGGLIKVDGAKMLRYEQDETVTFVASWGPLQAGLPVGARISFKGNSVSAQIFETWKPARVEDYVTATGQLAAHLHREGMQSAVGAPILVEGRLWGALLVGSVQIDPLPPDTETRIAQFAELVATAIANLEARAEVKRLADEQGALRRVAELVARESPADLVFATVAQELGELLTVSSASVLRLNPDNTGTVMAAWGMTGLERTVGQRLSLTGNSTAALAIKTGRPARRDDYSTPQGPIDELLSAHGARSAVACPVAVNGQIWGLIAVSTHVPEPLPPDTEERVARFTDLVATAIANIDAHTELAASRARIVAAADETRRRFERNLHDGAQQRLLSLALAIRGAQALIPPDMDDPRQQLARVGQGLVEVLDDLRELSHGLHPAILSEGGLDPALRALARRCTIPTRLDLQVEQRLSEPVEVAAYYVVSETLANAAKHAQASLVEVRAHAHHQSLELAIRDNGNGGADLTRGSGLIGLRDRVEALGGRIAMTSPEGQGTAIHVELPLDRD